MEKRRIAGMLAAALTAGILMAVPAYAKEVRFPDGIYVGDVSLGGMTESEAEALVAEQMGDLGKSRILLDVEGNQVETDAAGLGYVWKNQDAVKEAAQHALNGNLVERYMGQKDLEKNPVHIDVEASVDEEKLEAFVKDNCVGLLQEPVDAFLSREGDTFTVTPGVPGKTVDISATAAAVSQALAESGGEMIQVTAVVTEQEPRIKEEDLAGIQDVLGTFTTDFSSSGAARSKNLENGAAKINGRILMPGDTLSGYECLQPFTTENGYYTAAAYENGQVVDSIGGGVCQIATTLYNAALKAELEITQRQNHSMIVTYVKPSMDAAIAGTYKDIKITNNYSTPIYVEGGTSGKTLTFTIYGKETRPENRTVEYVSETLRTIDPGAPEERVDASMAPGARRQVQSAHRGLQSRLWKVVTVDGKETERTLLHEDTYRASKAIVMVGPSVQPSAPAAPAELAEAETPENNEAEESQPSIVEGIYGGPGVTGGQSGAGAAPQAGENQADAENAAAQADAENLTAGYDAAQDGAGNPAEADQSGAGNPAAAEDGAAQPDAPAASEAAAIPEQAPAPSPEPQPAPDAGQQAGGE